MQCGGRPEEAGKGGQKSRTQAVRRDRKVQSVLSPGREEWARSLFSMGCCRAGNNELGSPNPLRREQEATGFKFCSRPR